MPLVGTPAVGEIARDAKRLQQLLEPQEDVVLPPSEHIPQHRPGVVMLGKDKAQYLAACFLILPV
jgi:hypothetical protein